MVSARMWSALPAFYKTFEMPTIKLIPICPLWQPAITNSLRISWADSPLNWPLWPICLPCVNAILTSCDDGLWAISPLPDVLILLGIRFGAIFQKSPAAAGCGCVGVCVCVKHLNRCKTSIMLRGFLRFTSWILTTRVTAGGQSHVCSWLPNEEGCIHDWYDSGTLESRTCFNFQKWEEAQPKNLHVVLFSVSFLHSCHNLSILFFTIGNAASELSSEQGRRKQFCQFLFTWSPTPSSPTNSIIYYMNFADTSPMVLLMAYSNLVMSILNMKNTRKYFFYSLEASVFWCFVSNLHVSGFSSCRII